MIETKGNDLILWNFSCGKQLTGRTFFFFFGWCCFGKQNNEISKITCNISFCESAFSALHFNSLIVYPLTTRIKTCSHHVFQEQNQQGDLRLFNGAQCSVAPGSAVPTDSFTGSWLEVPCQHNKGGLHPQWQLGGSHNYRALTFYVQHYPAPRNDPGAAENHANLIILCLMSLSHICSWLVSPLEFMHKSNNLN